jgi:hypothetical protein
VSTLQGPNKSAYLRTLNGLRFYALLAGALLIVSLAIRVDYYMHPYTFAAFLAIVNLFIYASFLLVYRRTCRLLNAAGTSLNKTSSNPPITIRNEAQQATTQAIALIVLPVVVTGTRVCADQFSYYIHVGWSTEGILGVICVSIMGLLLPLIASIIFAIKLDLKRRFPQPIVSTVSECLKGLLFAVHHDFKPRAHLYFTLYLCDRVVTPFLLGLAHRRYDGASLSVAS